MFQARGQVSRFWGAKYIFNEERFLLYVLKSFF